jgi:hypothetical protein
MYKTRERERGNVLVLLCNSKRTRTLKKMIKLLIKDSTANKGGYISGIKSALIF